MQMTIYEKFGKTFGYCLGGVTASVSYLRSSRMFHPRGHLFEADVTSSDEIIPSFAMVRLSSGWWKNKEWPDALGIAIRFSHYSIQQIIPRAEDQDLLFVSFSSPWQLPFAPLITNFRDYLGNDYFTVAPFEFENQIVEFKLKPKFSSPKSGNRFEKLMESLLEGHLVYILYKRELSQNSWEEMAEIKLKRPLHYDQEGLRFSPFQNGLNIRPRGFLQYMRIGTYRLSQWARPASGIPDVN